MTGALDHSIPRRFDGRNSYVDCLRGVGLIALVVWHWGFTMVQWNPRTGPTAINPVGFTPGFWVSTWLFQASPLMFFVGGYAHLRSWERAARSGVGPARFVGGRLTRMALPGTAVLAVWVVLGGLAGWYFDLYWMARTIRLAISPLWFLAVYLVLIALLPLALWLHRRFGLLTLVWLAGIALCVDVARFRYHVDAIAWVNMLTVWALAHQAGFSYQALVDAPRRVGWALLWGGLFGLVGLVSSGLYPGSMIGVYGERFSNMSPPTFVIVALLAVQIGLVVLLRPLAEGLLVRRRWQWANATISRYALPLFLLHTTGMAMAKLISIFVFGNPVEDHTPPDLLWWLSRPAAVLVALLCTVPLIWLYGIRRARPFVVARLPRQRSTREGVMLESSTD